MRRRRIARRRAVYMRAALICVLVMAAVMAVSWFLRERPYTEYTVKEISGEGSSDAKVVTFGDRILRYSLSGAEVLDRNMSVIEKRPFEMAGPEAKVNGDYALVLDKGGREGFIFSRDGLLTSVKTQGVIGTGAVSAGGKAVLIVKDEGISAYLADGQSGLSEERITFEGFVPLAAAISENEETLIFAGIAEDTGESEIRFYNMKEFELIESFTCEGTVIPALYALPGNRVLAVGDDRVFIFKTGREPKEVAAEELDGVVLMAVSDGQRAVLLTEDRETGRNVLTVWNAAGLAARAETNLVPETAALSENEILLYNKSSLLIASVSGKIRFEGEISETGPVKTCVRIGEAKYRVATDYGTYEFDFK